MSYAFHPDDERLTALAASDQDAAADRTLVDHVSACLRCTEIVDDVRALRSALSELPDLAPSRPLQLVPPVPESPMAPSHGRWLRRLMAPVAAAGLVVAVVGAVGTVGDFGSPGAALFSSVGQNLAQPAAEGAPGTAGDTARNGGRVTAGATPQDPSGEAQSGEAPEFTGASVNPAADNASPGSPLSRSSHPKPSVTAEPSEGVEAPPSAQGQGNPPSPWVIVLVAGLAVTGGALAARWMIPGP